MESIYYEGTANHFFLSGKVLKKAEHEKAEDITFTLFHLTIVHLLRKLFNLRVHFDVQNDINYVGTSWGPIHPQIRLYSSIRGPSFSLIFFCFFREERLTIRISVSYAKATKIIMTFSCIQLWKDQDLVGVLLTQLHFIRVAETKKIEKICAEISACFSNFWSLHAVMRLKRYVKAAESHNPFPFHKLAKNVLILGVKISLKKLSIYILYIILPNYILNLLLSYGIIFARVFELLTTICFLICNIRIHFFVPGKQFTYVVITPARIIILYRENWFEIFNFA